MKPKDLLLDLEKGDRRLEMLRGFIEPGRSVPVSILNSAQDWLLQNTGIGSQNILGQNTGIGSQNILGQNQMFSSQVGGIRWVSR